MRSIRLASLLIVGAVVAGGCGGDDGAGTPTSIPTEDDTEPPPLSLAFEQFESDGLGYRIEIPEGWAHEETSRVPPPGAPGGLDTFHATRPIDGGQPRITVLKTPAGGRTVEEVLSAEGIAGTQDDDLALAGHDAVRVDVTSQGEDLSQVFVVIDDTLWALTLAVEAGNRDRFFPTFEHIYQSFQAI